MPRNQSNNERYFRLVMFMFIITLAVAWQSWILLAIALYPLVTSVIGFCPIYFLTGYSTYEQVQETSKSDQPVS